MRALTIVISLCLMCLTTFAQQKKSFEGIIEYEVNYISQNSEPVNKAIGDKAIVYLKKGNYKQEYPNSKIVDKVVYRAKENLYYSFPKYLEKYEAMDMSDEGIALLNIEKHDTTVTILGYPCKTIQLNFENLSVTYYYAEDLYMNPMYYKDHKSLSYDKFLAKTSSVYLKTIISNGMYDVVLVATKIKQKKIKDKEFDLD